MTPEWEWVPVANTPTAVRFAYRVFGVDRVRRWVVRVDGFLDGEPRPPRPRCPWTTALPQDQCVNKAGHRGVCMTEMTRTNKRTGRSWIETTCWYGINYDVR